MDDVKLAKLIDKIVKQRLTEILANNKEIKRLIKEEVKSQLISVLLENKINVNQQGKTKRTSQISELLNNKKEVRYPKIEKREHREPIVERQLVRDPVLNQILNATPYVPDSGGGFTGNALMDSMGINNESMLYAQNIASGLGKNVKIDINPDAVSNMRNNIPTNAQFITDKKTNLKEYVGDDGFKYVDDRMLFENEGAHNPVMQNPMATVNLERALNKNYKQLLSKMDEKAQRFRNKPLNRIN